MKERFQKIVNILIIFTMLFEFVPFSVFASTGDETLKGKLGLNSTVVNEGKFATVEAGSLTNEGDVLVKKIVEQTNVLGKFKVTFEIEGKEITDTQTTTKPVYAVVVFDKSGSMEETCTGSWGNRVCDNKWNNAVNGAKTFATTLLSRLPEAKIALVTFSGNDGRNDKAYDDAKLVRGFQSTNLNSVNFSEPNGGTNLGEGLRQAKIELDKIKEDAYKYVVVIGDGKPTFYSDSNGLTKGPGNSMSEETKGYAYTHATSIKNSGAEIFSIGYAVSNDKDAQTVLRTIASTNKDTDTIKHYYEADPQAVANAFNNIATSISVSNAGKNAVLKDNLGKQFSLTSGNNIINIGEITEEKITTEPFYITIDPDSTTGWHDTNAGFTLTYTKPNGEEGKVECNVNPQAYWIQNEYDYKIEYYYEELNGTYTLGNETSGKAHKGDIVSADITGNNKTGFVYAEAKSQDKMTIKNTGNLIKVYYDRQLLNYEIHYFYNGVEGLEPAIKSTAKFNTVINGSSIDKKEKVGYIFDKITPETLTISTNEELNVINVYHVIDNNQTKDLKYTVNYYKDNVLVEADTITRTKKVQVLEPNTLTVNTSEINITNKYTGYKLDSVKTGTIPTVIENNGVINVYYVKDTFAYSIEYYYDGVKDNSKTETGTALFETVINSYPEKLVDGYKFDKVTNKPLTISANASNNIIKVYYVKNCFGYTVEYYYDGVIDNSKTESGSAKFNSTITTYTDKIIDGYKLDKKENLPLTITSNIANNVIRIYYVKDNFGYTVEYYYDGVKDNSKTENGSAKFNSTITTYTDKNIDGYKLDKKENLPLTITSNVNNNVIRIYYVKNCFGYKVEYYYDGVIDNSKTENSSAKFNSTITTYTDKNINGYKLDKEENLPLTITSNTTNNVIRIYYVKDNFGYTVEYYYDGIKDATKTETAPALFGSKITSYTDKVIDGYVYESDTAPLTITSNEEVNVIRVYYVRRLNSYIVEYHLEKLDGTFEKVDSETEIKYGLFNDPATFDIKSFTNYTYNELLTVNGNTTVPVTSNLVIKLYYELNSGSAKVEHYILIDDELISLEEFGTDDLGNKVGVFKENDINVKNDILNGKIGEAYNVTPRIIPEFNLLGLYENSYNDANKLENNTKEDNFSETEKTYVYVYLPPVGDDEPPKTGVETNNNLMTILLYIMLQFTLIFGSLKLKRNK